MEIETIKNSQGRQYWRWKNLGKRSEIIDAGITNKIQETDEIISGIVDNRKHWLNNQRKCKMQKAPKPKYPDHSFCATTITLISKPHKDPMDTNWK